MRIVNVMLGKGRGGIEQAVVDYSEALRQLGHETVAIVHPGAAILPQLRAGGISTQTLANWGAWDFVAAIKLHDQVKQFGAEVCIAHGNRAISLLKMTEAPRIVGVMHNYKIKCRGLRFLLYPTQDLLNYIHRHCGAGIKAYHMPNMVRVPAQSKDRRVHTPPVIGSMGRFVAKKGFDLFIESLALLKEHDIPFRAILAGGGEEEQALKKLAHERGLGDRLEFAGWVEDKQAFFDSIDVFCLPSHHEPFGIVLLEAMAQGLPVIATKSEGPSEILDTGEPGMLVPTNDAQALAESFALLLTDPERAERLGKNAYETARSRYDLPVVARKLDLALLAVSRL